MRLKSIILLILVLPILSNGQARFIEIKGKKVYVNTLGLEQREPGTPLVIFESGHGTPMDNWDKVIEEISTFAPVLTYDRAGIGQSEATEDLPTVEYVSERLLKICSQLELEPPYILVGHSLGGMYVRGFANLYPDKLAGLVIIDPADFTETSHNIRDHYEVLNWSEHKVDSLIQHFIDIRKRRRQKAPLSIKNEGKYLASVRAKDFKSINSKALPNIPVHIITSGRFDKPVDKRSSQYDEEALFRSKMKHRIARWTSVINTVEKGKILYSSHAGHFVQWDDPNLVIASVNMVFKDYQATKLK